MPGGVVVDATGGLLKGGRHFIFVQHLKSCCPVMPYHRFGIFRSCLVSFLLLPISGAGNAFRAAFAIAQT